MGYSSTLCLTEGVLLPLFSGSFNIFQHSCFLFLHIAGGSMFMKQSCVSFITLATARVCLLLGCQHNVFYVSGQIESQLLPLFLFGSPHSLLFVLGNRSRHFGFQFSSMSLPLGANLSIVWCAWCQITACKTSGSQRLSMSVSWFLSPLSFGLLGFWWQGVQNCIIPGVEPMFLVFLQWMLVAGLGDAMGCNAAAFQPIFIFTFGNVEYLRFWILVKSVLGF